MATLNNNSTDPEVWAAYHDNAGGMAGSILEQFAELKSVTRSGKPRGQSGPRPTP